MSVFTIKRGDTSPAIVYALSPVVNLIGATVVFNMRGEAGAPEVVRASASVVGDPMKGTVSYLWQPADTAQVGTYRGEFEVTFADGTVETFPNNGFIHIRVGEDLG